jgi:hypothetical protein
MNNPGKWQRATSLTLVVLALLLTSTALAQVDPRKVMEGVFSQIAGRDMEMKMNFETFDRQGHSTKREFNYLRTGTAEENKVLAAFTSPQEIRGVVLLSINRHGLNSSQYLYTPATQRVRNVAPQERSSRFIGTDFSFEDIGERDPGDFSYRLIGDTESIDGHKTYKIEALPLDQGRSQYKYIYYWVAQDVPVILFAEFYDAQGAMIRVMHSTALKHENGVWGARHTEMRTPGDGTRTVLTIDAVKFNAKLNEKLFTPQGMAAALDGSTGK